MSDLSPADDSAAYRDNGYVLLKQLFPPVVLSGFDGTLQHDLQLKTSNEFVSQTEDANGPYAEQAFDRINFEKAMAKA